MSDRRERHSTWVEIDLDAIEHNTKLLSQRTGVNLMAVVKANAYGHGAVPAARAARRGGASWFGVARIEEALELRQAAIKNPILILGYIPPTRLEEAISKGISLTAWNEGQIRAASQVAEEVGADARLHIKVDTGMSRLGVQPERAFNLVKHAYNLPRVTLEGVFTHFARADERDPKPTDAQEATFQKLVETLQAEGLRPPYVHAANSAAGLTRPSAYFDLVRMGIALYGLHPSADCRLSIEFRTALTWKTVVSQVKTLPVGTGISYGHTYTTSAEERIGTLPVGYADGFRRLAGNQVLIHGVKAPVVGRVTMDQIMVRLDGIPRVKAGDEVVLIGQQGGVRISAEDLAEIWGTINYEVVCAIGPRVPRFFL